VVLPVAALATSSCPRGGLNGVAGYSTINSQEVIHQICQKNTKSCALAYLSESTRQVLGFSKSKTRISKKGSQQFVGGNFGGAVSNGAGSGNLGGGINSESGGKSSSWINGNVAANYTDGAGEGYLTLEQMGEENKLDYVEVSWCETSYSENNKLSFLSESLTWTEKTEAGISVLVGTSEAATVHMQPIGQNGDMWSFNALCREGSTGMDFAFIPTDRCDSACRQSGIKACNGYINNLNAGQQINVQPPYSGGC